MWFPVQDDDHFYTANRYVERHGLRASQVERAEDWRLVSFYRWSRGTLQQKSLLPAWPLPRRPGWIEHVNKPQTEAEAGGIASLRTARMSVRSGSVV
jgi:putative transposase